MAGFLRSIANNFPLPATIQVALNRLRMAAISSRSYYVGVDLGGTKILAGAFNRYLKLRNTVKFKTKAVRGVDAVIDRIERAVREVVSESGLQLNQIRAIGLGVPGSVSKGRVIHANNIGWDGVPVGTILRRKLRTPVFVENDCNLFTLGIHQVELKRRPKTMIGVFLGTGVGGGIIINGELYRGFNNAGGEFGQISIDKDGLKTGHHLKGSFESLASRQGIVRRLRRAVLEGGKTMLLEELGPQLKNVRSRHLRKAVQAKDVLVQRVVRNVAVDTGIAIAGLISVFGSEYVVLGGGVIEALHQTMLPIIKRTATQNVLPETMNGVKIVLSKLGDDGGICGAAVFARESLKK